MKSNKNIKKIYKKGIKNLEEQYTLLLLLLFFIISNDKRNIYIIY